jgi:hypothetical protein
VNTEQLPTKLLKTTERCCMRAFYASQKDPDRAPFATTRHAMIRVAETTFELHTYDNRSWFMKVDPMLYVSQFFHFLDWVISQYGLYLFMAFVYLCPFIIWWVHRWAKKHPEANVRPNILIYWIFPPRK